MTDIYKIPDAIAEKYHGAGHALASVTGGQIVDLIYLADVFDDFDPENLQAAINDSRLAPTIRELQSTGKVFVGMCSCWEFIEL